MVHPILLIRHGNHPEVGRVLSGRSEIALDAVGEAQAEALAAMLGDTPLAAIHASPRRRCRETAARIAARTGLEVATAAALDEIDFGTFMGRGFAELKDDPDWRRWNAERDTARCPGGETMAEAVARAADFLRSLPRTDAPIACVTHCDIIRGLAAAAIGLPWSRMFDLPCDPGSVTTVEVAGDAIRLVTLNARPPASSSSPRPGRTRAPD